MLDATTPIGADGTVKVAIDTALAKTLHGNSDHRYAITAEVVDQSRRTIVGSGEVLVARKPFQIFAWSDRGYYQVGDAIHATFQAQTLDHKPVKGKGVVTLYRVTYSSRRKAGRDVGTNLGHRRPTSEAARLWNSRRRKPVNIGSRTS